MLQLSGFYVTSCEVGCAFLLLVSFCAIGFLRKVSMYEGPLCLI